MAALLGDPRTGSGHATWLPTAGAGPRLLWVNAGPVFRPLARILAPRCTLVSVPFDLGDIARLGDRPSLAEIAAILVETIVSIQPDGPYHLGGRCMEGVLAFAAAAQLVERGAEVRQVFLLDAVNPAQPRREGLSRWRDAAARLHGCVASVAHRIRPTNAYRFERAAAEYRPPPYRGAAMLLQARDHPDMLECRAGWADIVDGEFAAVECPGDHATMLDPPHVQILGAAIRDAIAAAPVRWADAAE
jgi:phthiocerol/phenolphthiocerol synthesis type-I polyketide synthase D